MSKPKSTTDLIVAEINKITQSEEWSQWRDATTLGADAKQSEYLGNRLARALDKGIEAGRMIELRC